MLKSLIFFDKKTITFSTLLTCIRIAIIPLLTYTIITHAWPIACALFTFAALTDVLDGALARFLKQETVLGAYLDPLADKLLVISCYVTLAYADLATVALPLWFLGLMILKELCLSIGVVYLGVLLKGALTIKPTILSKVAMVLQIGFLWCIFLGAWLVTLPLIVYIIFLLSIALLTIIVFIQYSIIGYKGYRLWAIQKSGL